jgi:hypothetical protein
MHIGQVLIGLAGIALGARAIKKGATELSSGLRSGGPHASRGVERDPGKGAPEGRRVGAMRGKTRHGSMHMELREVKNLDERINAIRAQARKGRVDPRVIAWARAQVSRKCPDRPGGWCIPEKDTESEIKAIFYGLRRDVRYTSDVLGVDTYAHPRRTLEMASGDCDDYSSLGCAALLAIGIPCRYKVVRTKDSPVWNHIYIEAGTPKHAPARWIPLDASVDVKPGWEVPASQVAEARVFEMV